MNLIGKKTPQKNSREMILTKEVPFAVEEAYKSLRTNLIFSLPEEKCKIPAEKWFFPGNTCAGAVWVL